MRTDARAAALLIFGLALLLRLGFVLQYQSNPRFDRPIIDALTYHEWGVRIAAGEGLGEGGFTRAPLYPIFLGAVYRLAGIDSSYRALEPQSQAQRASRAIRAAKLIQAVLGALSALLITLAGAGIAGRRAGAIAGALFAIHPVPIFYCGELFGETLGLSLTLCAFFALSLALRQSGRREGLALLFAAGIALGLSAITRPTILPVALALALVLLALRWRQRSAGAGVRASLALGIGVALAIAPVTYRNHREGAGFVLISSQGGVNLWMGNNADGDGKTALSPGRGRTTTPAPVADIIDVAARRIAEAEAGRALTAGEVSDYWGERAREWILGNPTAFARLMLRKCGYFFGAAEIWDQQCDVDFLSRFSPILDSLLVAEPLSLPNGLILPFALVGIFIAARSIRTTWPALLFFCVYLGGVLLFFVASRYRLPELPFLFLFAGICVDALIGRWRARGPRGAAPLVAAIVLVAAPINRVARHPLPIYQSRARVFVANAWIEKGDPAAALPLLEEAMTIAPRAADPYYALGAARRAMGDLAGARLAFQETLARDPGFERAAVNLGNLHAQAGEWEEALPLYSRALDLQPGDPLIRANLLSLAGEAGRNAKAELAERALQRLLQDDPDDAAALNAMAWNLAERLGRPREAVGLAERAKSRAGDSPEINDTLGWALVLAGDAEIAIAPLRSARQALPDHPDVAMHLGVALRLGGGGRAEADSLLQRAFEAPGGDARRARAESVLRRRR